MARTSLSRTVVALRVAAALVGGYGFAWGFIALTIAVLYAAGMDLHDAQSLAAMSGILAFATMCLWAFASRSVGAVWAALAGGGLLMAGAASFVQSIVVR